MSSKLPNIILMVLDTVGAKHLSLYGYKRPTTPNLERIAQECTVYTRCFSSGVLDSAFPCLYVHRPPSQSTRGF